MKLLTIPAFYATRVPVGAILPPCVHLTPLPPRADTLAFSYVKMLTGGSSSIQGEIRAGEPNTSIVRVFVPVRFYLTKMYLLISLRK